MTDKELFLKYNNVDTKNYIKNEDLDKKLFNGEIKKNTYLEPGWIVLLHASYACNANCIYCENHSLREKYNNAIMSEDIVRQVVKKLGSNLRTLTWHGGEPLLLPESLFIAAEDEKKKHGFTFTTNLQTNSILLTPQKKEFLDSLGIYYGTSFDGLYNTRNRGEKSTEAILRRINQEGPLGFINVTLNDSIYHLIDNYEYLKTLGIRDMQNCIVRENVIDATNPYLIDNKIVVEQLVKYFKYWMYDNSKDAIEDIFLTRQLQRIFQTSKICEDVLCAGRWLIIDPLGNIGTCGMSVDEQGWVNIRDIESPNDLIGHKGFISTINKQKRLIQNHCSDCEWLYACNGACLGLNFEQDHSYNTINQRNCDLQKMTLDAILSIIIDLDLSDTSIYNEIFLNELKANNYYSLSEIKKIEEKYSNA